MSIEISRFNGDKFQSASWSITFHLSGSEKIYVSSFDWKKNKIEKIDTTFEEMIENLKKQSIVYGNGSVFIKDIENDFKYVRLTRGVNGKLVMEYQCIDKEKPTFYVNCTPLYIPKLKVCEIDVTQQLRNIFSYVPNLF